jgi:deoxyribonuclease IV
MSIRREAPTASRAKAPIIGAQLSTAGGFAPVPERAVAIGAEVAQVFNTNPRMWRARIPAPTEIEALTAGLRKHRLRLFFHSIYLINLASADDELRQRSLEALALALASGAAAGAEAVVTHIGSHRGEAVDQADLRIVQSIAAAFSLARDLAGAQTAAADRGTERLAAGARELPRLLLETAAGAGNTVGGRLEDLANLISLHDAGGTAGPGAGNPDHLPAGAQADADARSPTLGICIDTAHLFAAGYAVHEETGLEELIAELRELKLLDRTGLVHLNDSRTAFASRRDYHENLGEGLIGYEALSRVVRHPALTQVPFVLEVPGAEGHGPDAASMALAKRMRSGAARPVRRHRPAPKRL